MQVHLKCLSHTPLRGLSDPGPDVTAEVDQLLERQRQEVEAFDPELIILFGPDHYNGLFYDLMPQFVIATDAISVGDYGTTPGSLGVHSGLAAQLHAHLLEDGFDAAISHRLQVDHGCTQTLEELTGSLARYPVIPVVLNCVAPPLSPFRRVRELGHAVGKFIASLDKRILILGTGGLSHEPPVKLIADATEPVREFLIAGRNPTPEARAARQANTIATGKVFGTEQCDLTPLNPEWDEQFIDLLVGGRVPEVDVFENAEVSRVAGRSAHEVRTWVAAFAAMQAIGPYTARREYYRPINEWIAGYGAVSAALEV